MAATTPPEQWQYLTIEDFSPGIFQRKGYTNLTNANPAPLGAAQATNTYRCIALAGGGLGPLPKRYYDFIHPVSGSTIYTVTGFHSYGPVTANVITAPVNDEMNVNVFMDEVYLGYGYDGAMSHDILSAKQIWIDPNNFNNQLTLMDDTSAIVGGGFGRSPIYIDTWVFANGTPPPTRGFPGIIFSWSPPYGGNAQSCLFPDPDGAATTPWVRNTGIGQGGLAQGGFCVSHQGRQVIATWEDTDYGFGYYFTYNNEILNYTAPYSEVYEGFVYAGPETPHGIGTMKSLSASDLFIVKHRGGAYLVQGDISYPIIRHLPGVTSTGGTQCDGVNSSIGYIYGVNKGGVVVWDGAESSTQLSSQLEDNFWISPNSGDLRQYKGKFAQWKNLVMVPNSWVYDITTKGWWRLEDTTDPVTSTVAYNFFTVSNFNNVLFGARERFTAAGGRSPIAFSAWDPATPATSYSWNSQPLGPTLHRKVEVREVQFIAQGTGTIAYTLSGQGGSSTSGTVTLAGTGVRMYRKNVALQDTHISIRIVADNGASAAPIVHSIRLGYVERAGVPKT